MDIIPLSGLIGFAFIIITSLLSNRKILVKKYTKMDKRKLVYANIFAKKFIKIGLFLAFIAPLPICYLLSIISNGSSKKFIIAIMILMIMGSISMAGAFWSIAGVTEAELKLRQG